MEKNVFQKLHGFSDEDMAKIQAIRDIFGCHTPCKVKDKKKGKDKWIEP